MPVDAVYACREQRVEGSHGSRFVVESTKDRIHMWQAHASCFRKHGEDMLACENIVQQHSDAGDARKGGRPIEKNTRLDDMEVSSVRMRI